jgi:hypothetical protein
VKNWDFAIKIEVVLEWLLPKSDGDGREIWGYVPPVGGQVSTEKMGPRSASWRITRILKVVDIVTPVV